MSKKKTVLKLKVKTLKSKIKASDEGEGIIEAYVSVFGNVDLAGDIIERGAFGDSLAKKLPAGVWMHNWELPIAKTLEAKEDDHGLYIKAKFILDVEKGKEAYTLIKEGVIDQFSIGYMVDDFEVRDDGVYLLKKITLFEWSPVLVPANDQTELLAIKGKKEVEVEMPEEDKEEFTSDEETEEKPEEVEENTEVEETPEEEKSILSEADVKIIQEFIKSAGEMSESLMNALSALSKFNEKGNNSKVDGNLFEKANRKSIMRIRKVAKQKHNDTVLLLRRTKKALKNE